MSKRQLSAKTIEEGIVLLVENGIARHADASDEMVESIRKSVDDNIIDTLDRELTLSSRTEK